MTRCGRLMAFPVWAGLALVSSSAPLSAQDPGVAVSKAAVHEVARQNGVDPTRLIVAAHQLREDFGVADSTHPERVVAAIADRRVQRAEDAVQCGPSFAPERCGIIDGYAGVVALSEIRRIDGEHFLAISLTFATDPARKSFPMFPVAMVNYEVTVAQIEGEYVVTNLRVRART